MPDSVMSTTLYLQLYYCSGSLRVKIQDFNTEEKNVQKIQTKGLNKFKKNIMAKCFVMYHMISI